MSRDITHSGAHLAFQNAILEPLVDWPANSLAARHTKVRRDGYQR